MRARRSLPDRLASGRIAFRGCHLIMPGPGRVEHAGAGFRFLPASA